MELLKNRKTLMGIAAALVISTGILVANASFVGNKYNTSPDVSSKVVGSEMAMEYKLPLDSLEQLADKADLIVIGRVVDDGVTKKFNFEFKDDKGMQAFKEKFEKQGKEFDPSYTASASQIKIDKVIYGDTSLKEITLLQDGKAGSDFFETKVKKGEKMFFILKKAHEQDNAYVSVSKEDGLFKIDAKNKLLSMSKEKVVAKYDGVDVGLLEQDIKKIKK